MVDKVLSLAVRDGTDYLLEAEKQLAPILRFSFEACNVEWLMPYQGVK